MKSVILPIGRSGFEDIRENNYYYIDKTGFIEELIRTHGTQVTLITRPRRFGKTLAMSMLESFFDIRRNSQKLFEGLNISDHHELCEQWMNQYPTVFVSFKSIDGLTFADAYAQLVAVIAELYKNHLYLITNEKINSYDKRFFDQIADKTASKTDIKNSLLELSKILATYYDKPVILLIDEYDVPLAKASEKNYYPQMLDMMNGLLQTFKDNPSEDNVWSLLYLTGYLTRALPEEMDPWDTPVNGQTALKIPNAEVKEIFKNSIDQWFSSKSASCDYGKLWQSLWAADTEDLSRQLSDLLFDTIS